MGIQMEGPFFSEKKKGAQNGTYLRSRILTRSNAFMTLPRGFFALRMWRRSCRAQWNLPKKASKLCTVSIAHRDCTYEEASAVL